MDTRLPRSVLDIERQVVLSIYFAIAILKEKFQLSTDESGYGVGYVLGRMRDSKEIVMAA